MLRGISGLMWVFCFRHMCAYICLHVDVQYIVCEEICALVCGRRVSVDVFDTTKGSHIPYMG